MDRLKGKVAVITGASDGFARAIAVGYAREGAVSILQDRRMALVAPAPGARLRRGPPPPTPPARPCAALSDGGG